MGRHAADSSFQVAQDKLWLTRAGKLMAWRYGGLFQSETSSSSTQHLVQQNHSRQNVAANLCNCPNSKRGVASTLFRGDFHTYGPRLANLTYEFLCEDAALITFCDFSCTHTHTIIHETRAAPPRRPVSFRSSTRRWRCGWRARWDPWTT